MGFECASHMGCVKDTDFSGTFPIQAHHKDQKGSKSFCPVLWVVAELLNPTEPGIGIYAGRGAQRRPRTPPGGLEEKSYRPLSWVSDKDKRVPCLPLILPWVRRDCKRTENTKLLPKVRRPRNRKRKKFFCSRISVFLSHLSVNFQSVPSVVTF